MSDLEAWVRPFLCGMIGGTTTTLDEHMATLLTAWIYKIMLLFDRLGGKEHRRFTSDHYAVFHDTLKPPAGLVTWLAAYTGSRASTATDRGLDFNHGGKGVVATFSFGRVAFQLLFYNPHDLPRRGIWIPQTPLVWSEHLLLLWPVVSQTFSFSVAWPPSRVLDDTGLIKLRNRWDGGFEMSGRLLR